MLSSVGRARSNLPLGGLFCDLLLLSEMKFRATCRPKNQGDPNWAQLRHSLARCKVGVVAALGRCFGGVLGALNPGGLCETKTLRMGPELKIDWPIA